MPDNSNITKTLPNCNLCKTNPADHRGSHIFPRFLGVTLLTTDDNNRASFTTDIIDPELKQKPKQDTPKIPHILCCGCEAKIGNWERKFANEFYYPFKKGVYQNNCSITKNDGGFKVLINNASDYANFKLVVYSMAFRAAVSGHIAFSDLHLKEHQKETLRQILNDEIPFKDVPVFVMTSESDAQAGKNFIFASSIFGDVAWLWANEFMFFIDFEEKDEPFQKFGYFKMQNDNKVKVAVLENDQWDKFRDTVTTISAKQRLKDKASR